MKKNIIKEQEVTQVSLKDLKDKYKCPFLLGAKLSKDGSLAKKVASQNSQHGNYKAGDELIIKDGFRYDVISDGDLVKQNLKWKCDSYTKSTTPTLGIEQDITKLSPDQQETVRVKMENEGWSLTKPLDYDAYKDKYEIYRGIPGVILYKAISLKNITSSQIQNIQDKLAEFNYGFTVPAYGSREYNESRSNPKTLADFLSKEDARELGVRDLTVRVYPIEAKKALSRKGARKAERVKQSTEKQYRTSSTECQQNIEKLYYSLPLVTKKPRGFVALTDQTGLNVVRDKVKACIANEGEDGFTIMRGYGRKTDDMVKELLRNPDPKFGLKPSRNIRREHKEDNLKNVIKEGLINFDNNKKKTLTEERKIASNRFKIVLEGRNLKSKKEQRKIGNELFEEVFYLKSQGFDNKVIEESLFDFFKSILGQTPGGVVDVFKERLADKILSFLGVDPTGWIGGTISTAFGNLESMSDVGKLVSDCSFTTNLISKSIAEEAVNQLKQKTGKTGVLYDILSNSVVESLSESQLGQKIESALGTIICPLLSGVSTKMSDTEKELKEKVFS
jgi:hypothetical protein